MNTPLVDRIPFAKITVGLVIGIVVGLGLCGVGAAVSGIAHNASGAGSVLTVFLVLGGASFWLSVLGLILLFPLWVILSIVKAVNRE